MMTSVNGQSVSWRPATDEQLTWFKVGGPLPTHPKPLEFTCGVHAFAYGFTRALESLYFPFYEIRPRSIDGELYFAVVPSGLADRDIEERIRHVTERTIRFRDVLAVWKRDIQPEVQELLQQMAGFPPPGVSGEQLHEAWFRFRRVRALQWFAPIRAVICPAALLNVGIGEAPAAEAQEAVEGVREVVVRQGTEVFNAAIERLGQELVRSGYLDAPEEILWLEFDEVSAAAEKGQGAYRETAKERKSHAAATGQGEGPASIGPPLDHNDRRLFLLPEVFDLLGVTSPVVPV